MFFCLLPALHCAMVYGQELAFTSRAYFQSPVIISSVQGSKEFGFDSVVLRNDGPRAVTAVRLQVTFRTGAGDEIPEERRVPVNLDPHADRRLLVDLGQVDGLKQLAKSRKQESALVILTVEAVEFQDGGEWKQTEPERGVPIDPLPPQKPGPRPK
jgi:hypothetical protein